VSRYVVTGAAGFIGSRLAEALLDRGDDVVAIDCFTDYYDPALKEANAARLDVVRVDLVEEPLDALLADADGVFHLAGQPGVRASWSDFPLYVRRNVLASERVFDGAARRSVRVVFASSSSVYGNAEAYPTPEDAVPQPISPYGITKLGCEHLAAAFVQARGLDCVVLRYFTVYGPRQRPDMAFARLIEAAATGGPFELYGDGSQTRGFTYVDDAIAATLAAMEGAGSHAVYNVGGGSEASMREVLAIVEQLAGRPIDVRIQSDAPGDVRRTAADTTRIRRELGWQPAVALDEGLKAQFEWTLGRVGAR
jgi:UDP-glucuronate 4-epimerase